MPPNDATLAQIEAADPGHSTWVSANAGAGKTRVLTDRVARLLLMRVPPQKILCLTYTKAAASNMQNTLFSRLGDWSMMPDAKLYDVLLTLGEARENLTPEFLRMSRTLFATALETPGGLKIQTIHSFCASLLRRFPLEAGVAPNFKEMDERSGKRMRADILEDLADGPDHAAFDAMARYLSGDDPDKFLIEVASNKEAFDTKWTKQDIWQAFELPPGFDEAAYLDCVFPKGAKDILVHLIAALHQGGVTDIKNAEKLASLNLDTPSMGAAIKVEDIFVYGDRVKNPGKAKTDRVPTKALREANGELMAQLVPLMLAFEAGKPLRLALAAAQKTFALHQFASAFLPEYERQKQRRGWLDFDDLIFGARALLTQSDMAQWVLYKLDGGIDHILVDEAQDTSPAQWHVIERLAEEFMSGKGARDIDRTIFVVGDEKQSIFSFQGADPAEFSRMRKHFESHLKDISKPLLNSKLKYSFRSSAAVLNVVDIVINDANQANLSLEIEHSAYFSDLPGRVDLWPFKEAPKKGEKGRWDDPVDMPLPGDPSLMLAREIAQTIRKLVDQNTPLTTTKETRAVVPGDFLILVQRRSDMFHEIIRALKAEGLPVAGADRLRIGAELAVRDLTSLLSFLVTPEDDLSLAETLRSPLFAVSEEELFSLAHGRKGYLWAELRNRDEDFPTTCTILGDLLSQADFLRPYDLLERVLTRHDGRERLIARLGKEASEGIDALLNRALLYEQEEAPSLTGFLEWMERDESDIKRQMDTEPTEIRVMTVHGAKGLESPIVILPDTGLRKAPSLPAVLRTEKGLAVWTPRVPDMPEVLRAPVETQRQLQEQERMRLFYVAMTRAENWLIVCGAGDKGKSGQSWYSLTQEALEKADAHKCDFFGQTITRFEPFGWSSKIPTDAPRTAKGITALPKWAATKAPGAKKRARPLSPSDLGGAKAMGGDTNARSEEAAKRHGRQVHALLEHLPKARPEQWPTLARHVLSNDDIPLDESGFAALLAEVTPILTHPDLAFVFAPETLAEVPVCARLAGQKMFGLIDRLVIRPDHVLIVDFKTNATVPDTPEATPEGILRQMGAYGEALAQIYPKRRIETAILWTKTASLMRLSHEIVTQSLKRMTTP